MSYFVDGMTIEGVATKMQTACILIVPLQIRIFKLTLEIFILYFIHSFKFPNDNSNFQT